MNKNVCLFSASVFLCFSVFVLPVYADEPITDFGDFGLTNSAGRGTLPGVGADPIGTGSSSRITLLLGNLTGSVLTFVGVIFLLLMIYAGFVWMQGSTVVGGGATKRDIDKAKLIMKAAVTGLAIIFLSYTIVSFVINIAERASNPPPAAEKK